MANEKRKIDSRMMIPAGLLIGIGVGFLLITVFPTAIPAFTLFGLGLGFLAAYMFREKK